MNNTAYKFAGAVKINSSLTLEELSEKISDVLLGGTPFIYGKDPSGRFDYIWDEIPSMYIEQAILGFSIEIGEMPGMRRNDLGIGKFVLIINSTSRIYSITQKERMIKIDLDLYLYHLLRDGLKDYPEIELTDPCESA
jgi:hypothetical protein